MHFAAPPPPKKNSLADRPIYLFHFNIHFLKALLAPRWSQAPRHSVTSYAPTCAPQVIVYFRCLLESLLDFRSGACRFRATEAATGVFRIFACLPCPRGCLTVFLYSFLCPVATTTMALLSELLLPELDSDDGCRAIAQIVALDDGPYPRRQLATDVTHHHRREPVCHEEEEMCS